MDISKLRQSQLIVGAAGIALVLSLFLNWVGVSAFSAFSAMDIVMLLVGLGAVGYAAIPASGSEFPLPKDSSWIVLLLAMAVVGWALGIALEDADAGIGAWLGLIASAAIAFGAYVEVRGGTLARPMARAARGGPSAAASGGPAPTAERKPEPDAGESEPSGPAEA